jgi:hypothetical protein
MSCPPDPYGQPRAPRDHEPIVAALVVSLAVLAVSLAFLVAAWSGNLKTVHTVTSSPAIVRLGPGTYWIYQDPGGPFPMPAGSIKVTGPAGRIDVRAVSYELSPLDLTAPLLLPLGEFLQVAGFTVPAQGTYEITLSDMAGNSEVFVAETRGAAARRALPWIADVLVSATAAAWSRWRLRRLRVPCYPRAGPRPGERPRQPGRA